MSTKTAEKATKSSIGAPAQYAQSTRKGKKAWRKNVDIGDVEAGMDELRAEERETGSTLQSKTNEQLFEIDVKGDDKARRSLPKFDKSQLSYSKALVQRSAVPAALSRSSSARKRPAMTHEDKTRLLRIGKRKRLGPFNSVVDSTQLGEGSALLEPSHAVRESGTYDIWSSAPATDAHSANVASANKTTVADDDSEEKKNEEEDVTERDRADFLLPLVQPPPPKAPKTAKRDAVLSRISLPAVVAPPAGASYNPPAEAHASLLRIAHERAVREETAREREKGVKAKLNEAKKVRASEMQPGVPTGMTVDKGREDEAVEEVDEELPATRKAPVRKTKQQRHKAQKAQAERREAAERAAKKRFLASLSLMKRTRTSIQRSLAAQKEAQRQKQLALQEKLRTEGLSGKRIGKHIVREEEPIVQLGEDLSESLRGLKVEGNLFKDRYLSLQHRALLEPRVPVLPRKHRKNTKEVEKFAWKRFE